MDARISMNINQLLLNRVCIPKAPVIKPSSPPPCASHVLYLIIYFPTIFCLCPNLNFDQIQNQAGFRSCSVWRSRAAGPQYGVLHRTPTFQRPHKLHAGKYFTFFDEFNAAASQTWSALHCCVVCLFCCRAPVLLTIHAPKPGCTFAPTESLN